jgi:hypothetical protein
MTASVSHSPTSHYAYNRDHQHDRAATLPPWINATAPGRERRPGREASGNCTCRSPVCGYRRCRVAPGQARSTYDLRTIYGRQPPLVVNAGQRIRDEHSPDNTRVSSFANGDQLLRLGFRRLRVRVPRGPQTRDTVTWAPANARFTYDSAPISRSRSGETRRHYQDRQLVPILVQSHSWWRCRPGLVRPCRGRVPVRRGHSCRTTGRARWGELGADSFIPFAPGSGRSISSRSAAR